MKDESEFDLGDIHGQLIFNYRHPHIHDGEEAEIILRAFQRDFEVNGPSMVRIVRTMLAGWQRYKNHPDPRIRRRFAWDVPGLANSFSALLGAADDTTATTRRCGPRWRRCLRDLHREFGWKSWFYSAVGGRYVLWKIRREDERRLERGWTYEPATFYETNVAGATRPGKGRPTATRCAYVSPGTARVRPAEEAPVESEGAPVESLEPVAVV